MPKKKCENAEEVKETKTDKENTAEAENTAEDEKVEETKGKKSKKDDEKVKKLEEELAAQKDKYMRLAAEYDNYRKRTANEKLSLYDDATAKAVTELLPVADSVRMALDNLANADPEIVKGIELISNQLDKSFEKLKIESFGKIGDEFDPNLHNAISKVENEELGENTIAQVFQTGYKIGDKIIRHAMVQVANC